MSLELLLPSEVFNCATHLLGAAAVLRFAVPLVRRLKRRPFKSVSLGVFAGSAVFLLLASGLYHLTPLASPLRAVLRRVDHAAIFVLIAATFTPVHVLAFNGFFRWGVLGIIWMLAIAMLSVKMVFFAVIPEWVSLAGYLGIGWIGLLSFCGLCYRYGTRFAREVAYGGIAYSVGALADFFRGPVIIPGLIGGHELFHLAVLAGIAFHWRIAVRLAVFSDLRRPASGRIRHYSFSRPVPGPR